MSKRAFSTFINVECLSLILESIVMLKSSPRRLRKTYGREFCVFIQMVKRTPFQQAFLFFRGTSKYPMVINQKEVLICPKIFRTVWYT